MLPWIPEFPGDARVIEACVLLGMGAMFAAVVRCPFTSLIIIFEMTGNYSLILPLMAGNMLAWQIARRLQPVSIYNALLLQDGVSLRKLPAYRGAQDYRKLPVQVIMTHEVTVLHDSEPPAAALQRTNSEDMSFRAYPVMDSEGHLVGVVSRRELERSRDAATIAAILLDREVISVTMETPIRDAAQRMLAAKVRQVPVVSPADPRKLMGWLTLNDIARQQNAVEG
jgi:CIC family chloride channel protein